MKEPQSNIDRVTEYMTFGSPMHQIFAIEALTKWSKQVVAHADQLREEMKNSWIAPEAWIQSAKDWLATSEEPARDEHTKFGAPANKGSVIKGKINPPRRYVTAGGERLEVIGEEKTSPYRLLCLNRRGIVSYVPKSEIQE